MNIQLLLHRIIDGKLFFNYGDQLFYYLQPNNEIKYKAEILHTKILEDNIYESWTRSEDLPRMLNYLDLWNNDDEKLLEQTMKKIDPIKLSLYNNRLNKKKTDETRKNLLSTKNNVQILLNKKNALNYLTLEEYANLKKSEYIFLHSIFDANSEELYFQTDPSCVDHLIFDAVVTEISHQFISIEEYKTIARSEQWRSIWHSNKYNVFDRPACSLTDEQKSLISVSIMYDRIHEHPECPEDSVIEDDDMLDGWMIYQRQKTEASKKESNAQNFAEKHGNAQEIFVVANQEDIGSVYDMNSRENKNIIKQRTRVIANSAEGVDEVNLPDVQRGLLQKVNNIKR